MTLRFNCGNVAGMTSNYDHYTLEYLAKTEFELMPSIYVPEFTDPAQAETEVETWALALDAGIDMWVNIETSLSGASVPEGTTVEEYETLFGACADIYEAVGTQFKGFNWEAGWENAFIWMRDRTNKKISWCMYPSEYGWDSTFDWDNDPVPGMAPTTWTFSDYADYVDEMVWEVYSLAALGGAQAGLEWTHDNIPAMKTGIVTTMPPINGNVGAAPPYEDGEQTWWGAYLYHGAWYYDAGNPPLTWAEQKRRAKQYLPPLKELTGGVIDIFETMPTDPAYAGNNILDQVQFMQSLNVCALGTQAGYITQQLGLRPCYSGASVCVRPSETIPPDTFTNTGKEIILLKHGNIDDGCCVHDITVTSTDTLTHENYTIALNPDRGTFIGPYPVDDYGAIPTITYDTTNLYVSILKVVPYTDRT